MKRRLILPAIVLALSLPAAADEHKLQEGVDLLGEATRLLLEGMVGQIGPMMDELNKALGEINAYHPPEILPNGDIIIRRKVPLEEPDPEGSGEVEL